jgi:hypothetical protein
MTKQTFEKQGIQVWYDPKFEFSSDSTVDEHSKKMMEELKHGDDWNFEGTSSKTGISKIEKYAAPKKWNGHVESEGWSWQADVETMGGGSKARLVMACKPGDIAISSQKEDGTVKFGTGNVKKVVAHLTVKGKFRLIKDSKK